MHGAAIEREIGDLLEKAVFDQELRVALVHAHAAPDLGHQHADVVIHAEVRTDVAGRRREPGVSGEDGGDQRVVQIHDRPKGVERTFGERAFAAESGGGREICR